MDRVGLSRDLLRRFLVMPMPGTGQPLAAYLADPDYRADSWSAMVSDIAAVQEARRALSVCPDMDMMIQDSAPGAKDVPSVAQILRTCAYRILGEVVRLSTRGSLTYASLFACLMAAVPARDRRAHCPSHKVQEVRDASPEVDIGIVRANVFGASILFGIHKENVRDDIQRWAAMPEDPDGIPEQGVWLALMAATHVLVLCLGELGAFDARQAKDAVAQQSFDKMVSSVSRAISLLPGANDAETSTIANAIVAIFSAYWTEPAPQQAASAAE